MKANQCNRIRVVPFTNPSGDVVHRVYARMPDGRIIRENFQDYRLALARKQELEIEAVNSQAIIMMLPTRLSVSELRDAEAAHQVLKDTGFSLVDAANFIRKHYRPGLAEKTLKLAFDDFLSAKREANRGALTIHNLRVRIGRFVRTHGHKKVHQITAEEVRQAIHRDGWSQVSRNNERRTLHAFFAWALRKNLCLENPVKGTEEIHTCSNEPVALKLHEVRGVLRAARDHASGVVLPYVVLGVFCGLRPFEIRAISWENIDLRKKTIIVPAPASKPRRRRIVYISDNAVEWLLTCQGKALFPSNFQKHFAKVRKTAGFRGGLGRKSEENLKPWVADVLRHSAVSYFMGKYRNISEAADQFGNSPQVIFQNYREIVHKDDADAFYAIMPTSIDQDTVPKGDGIGVLVGKYNGNGDNRCVILTAAGCVGSRQTWPDLCILPVETWAGPLGLIAYAEERIHDIAILGPPYEAYDDYDKEREAWDEFCAKTVPMELAREALIPGQEFGVRIFKRDAVRRKVNGGITWVTRSPARGWMLGTAAAWLSPACDPTFRIGTDEGSINAFGGPVTNKQGQVLGIIGGREGNGDDPVAVQPLLGLPTWAVRYFFGSDDYKSWS